MKFLIKMYISSMKIALYTYLKGSASEIVSVALIMSSESPQSVPKKKKNPQRNGSKIFTTGAPQTRITHLRS